MKLTSEGAARLGRHESRGFPVGDFDFKPEDFDGCFHFGKDHIALTVEEAKLIISSYVDTVCELVKLLDIPELKINYPKPIALIIERIEKAEGK